MPIPTPWHKADIQLYVLSPTELVRKNDHLIAWSF